MPIEESILTDEEHARINSLALDYRGSHFTLANLRYKELIDEIESIVRAKLETKT